MEQNSEDALGPSEVLRSTRAKCNEPELAQREPPASEAVLRNIDFLFIYLFQQAESVPHLTDAARFSYFFFFRQIRTCSRIIAMMVPVINPFDKVEARTPGNSAMLSCGTNMMPTPIIKPNAETL